MIGSTHTITFSQSPVQIRLTEVPDDRYEVSISIGGNLWSTHGTLDQSGVFAFIKGFRLGAECFEQVTKIAEDRKKTDRIIAEIEKANAKAVR